MRFFDTHAHLQENFSPGKVPEVISRALDAGVEKIVLVGYDLPSSQEALKIAEQYRTIAGVAVGLHPHDAKILSQSLLTQLRRLAKHKKVVAYGEIGLDFYKNYSPRTQQVEAFRSQLQIASELSLPVILHTRDAFAQTFEILEEIKPLKRVVFHCFSGSLKEVKWMKEKDHYVSYSGSLTYNSKKLEEALKDTPKDRLLFETDSPFLTPLPFRGKKQNEPALIRYTVEKAAHLLDMSLEELAELSYQNGLKFFDLD